MMRILFFLLFSFSLVQSAASQIVITEINYNCHRWDDFEFLELYNNSGADIEMEGYYIGDGFDFTFPAMVFKVGEFLLLTIDSTTLKDEFGIDGLQWEDGTLSNSGEDISLFTKDSVLVDYVDYEDNSNGWSEITDGYGFSFSLCDVNADNEDPGNWEVTTDLAGVGTSGKRLSFATPGRFSACDNNPIVTPSVYKNDLIESPVPDSSSITFLLTNGNGVPSTISLEVDPSSTASPDDYEFYPNQITFGGEADTSITFFVNTKENDFDPEEIETLIFNIKIDANVGTLVYDQITYLLYDDDTELENSLVIVGIFNTNRDIMINEFGVELFALRNIPDLSKYGVGVANNGTGTDGVEIPLPPVSLQAGQSYFVSDSKARFKKFFGIDSDYQDPWIWATGDDAFQLYENGSVIDTYGLVDMDPVGTNWEYTAGWAVRKDNTGPDGDQAIEANWEFGGLGVLGGIINDSCANPYPLGAYSNDIVVTGTNELSEELGLKVFPNPAEDFIVWELDEETNKGILRVQIVNSIGALVMDKPRFAIKNRQIDVSRLTTGVYHLILRTTSGNAVSTFVK